MISTVLICKDTKSLSVLMQCVAHKLSIRRTWLAVYCVVLQLYYSLMHFTSIVHRGEQFLVCLLFFCLFVFSSDIFLNFCLFFSLSLKLLSLENFLKIIKTLHYRLQIFPHHSLHSDINFLDLVCTQDNTVSCIQCGGII